MNEIMMKVDQVASLLQISRASVYRLAQRREISHFTIKGKRRTRVLRFLRSDVEKFVRSNMINEVQGR